mgnify:CR=1 FL=1
MEADSQQCHHSEFDHISWKENTPYRTQGPLLQTGKTGGVMPRPPGPYGEYKKVSWSDRFNSRIIKGKPDECWRWDGGHGKAGYPMFWLDGQMVYVHHIMWEVKNNTERNPSRKYDICHGCQHEWCINPAHLEERTHKENEQDKHPELRALSCQIAREARWAGISKIG